MTYGLWFLRCLQIINWIRLGNFIFLGVLLVVLFETEVMSAQLSLSWGWGKVWLFPAKMGRVIVGQSKQRCHKILGYSYFCKHFHEYLSQGVMSCL